MVIRGHVGDTCRSVARAGERYRSFSWRSRGEVGADCDHDAGHVACRADIAGLDAEGKLDETRTAQDLRPSQTAWMAAGQGVGVPGMTPCLDWRPGGA